MTSAPVEVLQRYEKWKDIVKISGPQGLKLIRGFHDEALTDRAKVLAKALRCHPAVLVFPGWDVEQESAA